MTLQPPLQLTGAPGSPYTRKMVAFLRYRHIPYRLLIGDEAQRLGLPQPKVRLLPTFYLPNEAGDVEAVVDSTPLLRRFENEIEIAGSEGRNVLAPDPVVAFLDALLEDYGDEWLTKAMFHYRWYHDADADKSAAILPRWRGISAPEETMLQMGEVFKNRQVERLWVVGSNDTTAPVIESSYQRFVDIFRSVLERQPFLLGQRPGAADFAFYGQLSQLALFDPTPARLTLERAPRVYAWCDVIDDLSGLQVSGDGWIARDQLRDVLGDLLAEIGRVYAPFLIANARALEAGAEQVETTIDGQPWTQRPFPYQGKCLMWLREHHRSLDPADREAVDAVLDGTGCEVLFAD